MSNEITYAKLPSIYAATKRSKECLYILLWNNLQDILWKKKMENREYTILSFVQENTHFLIFMKN